VSGSPIAMRRGAPPPGPEVDARRPTQKPGSATGFDPIPGDSPSRTGRLATAHGPLVVHSPLSALEVMAGPKAQPCSLCHSRPAQIRHREPTVPSRRFGKRPAPRLLSLSPRCAPSMTDRAGSVPPAASGALPLPIRPHCAVAG